MPFLRVDCRIIKKPRGELNLAAFVQFEIESIVKIFVPSAAPEAERAVTVSALVQYAFRNDQRENLVPVFVGKRAGEFRISGHRKTFGRTGFFI